MRVLAKSKGFTSQLHSSTLVGSTLEIKKGENVRKRWIEICVGILGLLLLALFLFYPKEQEKVSVPETADIKLVRELTKCVDADSGTADIACLERDFAPLLSLGPNYVLRFDGGFGVNTNGRYLGRFYTMHVKMGSASGKTFGHFTIVFYVEKSKENPDSPGNYCTVFRADGGNTYGVPPKEDIEGIIDVYDLTRGNDSLVSGLNGEVSSFFRLMDSGVEDRDLWSPKHTTANLINSGKSVGEVIAEYLELTERKPLKIPVQNNE